MALVRVLTSGVAARLVQEMLTHICDVGVRLGKEVPWPSPAPTLSATQLKDDPFTPVEVGIVHDDPHNAAVIARGVGDMWARWPA